MAALEHHRLHLFTEVSEKDLRSDYVLSSLQTFETSLLLAAEGRWPSVIPLLFSACESLLRPVTGLTGKKPVTGLTGKKSKPTYWTSWELMDAFKRDVSSELHEKTGELREFRNDLLHRGYSPKDDAKCIEFFFDPGVPYFDALLKKQFGKDKRELSGRAAAAFWDVYRDTKKVVTKKGEGLPNGAGQAFAYMGLLAGRFFDLGPNYMTQLGDVNRVLPTPGVLEMYSDFVFHWEEQGQGDSPEEMYRQEIIQTFDQQDDAIIMDLSEPGFAKSGDPVCPLCDASKSIASLRYDEAADQYTGFRRFVCCDPFCPAVGKIISDPEVTSVFLWANLSEAQKAYFETDEPNCRVDKFDLRPST